MIPQGLNPEVEIVEQANTTWEIDLEKNTIKSDRIDGRDALIQAIYLILSVERYDYLIYSWNYGVELKELIGSQPQFAISEIKKRVSDALLVDNRIISVVSFEHKRIQGAVIATIVLNTIYGEVEIERTVNI